jgi:hypothetical protein
LPESINNWKFTIVPVLTIDGRVLYFDRKNHVENFNSSMDQDDIWYSMRTSDSTWTYPYRMPAPMNTRFSDVLFSISPDMSRALVYGVYNPETNQKIDGFSLVELDGTRMLSTAPIFINNYKNYSTSFYASMSSDFRHLILCIKSDSTRGAHDLYVSHYNPATRDWSAPENLGPAINSPKSEASPYLAPDGKTLYFSSERAGGSGGFDLYVSRRLDDTWRNWSEPKSLGAEINTRENDNGIYLTPLGDSAVIVSYDTTEKREGLFWVPLPKDLQPEPFAVLRGTLSGDSAGVRVPITNRVEFHVAYNSGKTADYFYSCDSNRSFYYSFTNRRILRSIRSAFGTPAGAGTLTLHSKCTAHCRNPKLP